jgi:histidinol-phosphate aminotransferase
MIGSRVDLHRLVPPHVMAFEPDQVAPPDAVLARRYGVPELIRLHNNENPLGPPDAARAVLDAFRTGHALPYPSGDAWMVRRAVAQFLGVDDEMILAGNGANEVIGAVVKTFCAQGDNLVTADQTFAVAEWVGRAAGVDVRLVRLRDHAFDAAGLLGSVDARTKLVVICNPNNPTGTWWPHAQLDEFLRRLDGRAIAVVDEAYREFVDEPDFPDTLALLKRHPNLIVFRTFSKAWGLAGLRLGYLIASQEIVALVRRVTISYSVNAVAQAAGAAALTEPAHLERTRAMVREASGYLRGELSRLGLPAIGRSGNFLLVRLPLPDTAAHRQLARRGFLVRTMSPFRFPNHIRVTFSTRPIMERFVEALEDVLRARQ